MLPNRTLATVNVVGAARFTGFLNSALPAVRLPPLSVVVPNAAVVSPSSGVTLPTSDRNAVSPVVVDVIATAPSSVDANTIGPEPALSITFVAAVVLPTNVTGSPNTSP